HPRGLRGGGRAAAAAPGRPARTRAPAAAGPGRLARPRPLRPAPLPEPVCAPRLHARHLGAARLGRLAHAVHAPGQPPLQHGLLPVLPAGAAAGPPGLDRGGEPPGLSAVVGGNFSWSLWLSPSEATESFISKKIWLAPPQFYEIRRLGNFASFSDLHKFCVDGALEGMERWLPITFLTADGMLQLLPGDELYLEDSDFVENVMSTEKKTEDIMKEGKTFHRVVLHGRHAYSVHVTVQSKYKHAYPKTYVLRQSRL
uniref:Nudix hydrolase 19 n=1 Tax=Suricata suricatta TaxID=37032 RepID=A0A673UXA4_SURSU